MQIVRKIIVKGHEIVVIKLIIGVGYHAQIRHIVMLDGVLYGVKNSNTCRNCLFDNKDCDMLCYHQDLLRIFNHRPISFIPIEDEILKSLTLFSVRYVIKLIKDENS